MFTICVNVRTCFNVIWHDIFTCMPEPGGPFILDNNWHTCTLCLQWVSACLPLKAASVNTIILLLLFKLLSLSTSSRLIFTDNKRTRNTCINYYNVIIEILVNVSCAVLVSALFYIIYIVIIITCVYTVNKCNNSITCGTNNSTTVWLYEKQHDTEEWLASIINSEVCLASVYTYILWMVHIFFMRNHAMEVHFTFHIFQYRVIDWRFRATLPCPLL